MALGTKRSGWQQPLLLFLRCLCSTRPTTSARRALVLPTYPAPLAPRSLSPDPDDPWLPTGPGFPIPRWGSRQTVPARPISYKAGCPGGTPCPRGEKRKSSPDDQGSQMRGSPSLEDSSPVTLVPVGRNSLPLGPSLLSVAVEPQREYISIHFKNKTSNPPAPSPPLLALGRRRRPVGWG